MINIFKKRVKTVTLVAPVDGQSVDLSEVPDKVFASGMMGPGAAFKYDGDTVTAPCAGKITLLPNTKHAFGITADNGAEILVHIGMDTVNLNGKEFEALAAVGDKVKAGDPIIKLDRAALEASGLNLITPVLVTNGSDYDVTIQPFGEVKQGQTAAVQIDKK